MQKSKKVWRRLKGVCGLELRKCVELKCRSLWSRRSQRELGADVRKCECPIYEIEEKCQMYDIEEKCPMYEMEGKVSDV